MLTNSDYLVIIQQFNKIYTKVMNEVAKEHGLTKVEVDILLFLSNNPGYDSAKDIVELRSIAKSYVSKAIEQLRAKSYLQVEEDKKDRRLSHLHIQDSALPVIHDAKAKQEEVFQKLLSGIPIHDLRCAQGVMLQIRKNLSGVI